MMRPKIPTNKVLLMLPFWNGDKKQSLKLARFLADLQPNFCEAADILFVARWDAKHGQDTLKYVSRKFKIFTHTSRRREIGWPLGCNGVFFGGLEWFYHKKKAGQIPAYRAVINMESDCVPLVRDWLPLIVSAWDEANRKAPAYVMGPLIKGDEHRRDHINGGCCLISGDLDFLGWLVLRAGNFRIQAGWDWVLAPDFQSKGWANIPGMRSYWQMQSFSEQDWNNAMGSSAFLIHGVKNDDLLDMSRKKLLG